MSLVGIPSSERVLTRVFGMTLSFDKLWKIASPKLLLKSILPTWKKLLSTLELFKNEMFRRELTDVIESMTMFSNSMFLLAVFKKNARSVVDP